MIFINVAKGEQVSIPVDSILNMEMFPVVEANGVRIDISDYKFERCEDVDETTEMLNLLSKFKWNKAVYWKPKNLICGYGETCVEFSKIFSETFYIEMGLRAVFKDLILSYMEENHIIVGTADGDKINFSNIWGSNGKSADRSFSVKGLPCFNEFFTCCDELDEELFADGVIAK